MVVSEGVLQSTPSRLGRLDAIIKVLELRGGDIAPCGGAGRRPGTHDLADLAEREAHLAKQQDRPHEFDRSFVVPALPRPSIVGLQDVKLLVVAQRGARHARALRQLADRQQLTIHLDFKSTLRAFLAKRAAHSRGEVGIADESGSRHLWYRLGLGQACDAVEIGFAVAVGEPEKVPRLQPQARRELLSSNASSSGEVVSAAAAPPETVRRTMAAEMTPIVQRAARTRKAGRNPSTNSPAVR
jgi:hypothetical protein